MSRHWLCYHRDGRPFAIVIIEAATLAEAPRAASFANLGRGAVYREGHTLDGVRAALVPAAAIGRMLTLAEAEALLDDLDRAERRKPPAESVRRRDRAGIDDAG